MHTQPQININVLAIILSMVSGVVFGFLWYGPLLGKKWAHLMGFNSAQKPDSQKMRKALLLQIIGLFLSSYVLTHTIQVWQPKAWGLMESPFSSSGFGFMAAFFVWIGFYIPNQLSKVAWENRP